MKLWKISQTVNNGYDTYDAAIVAAETAEEARRIPPTTAFDGSLNEKFISEYWQFAANRMFNSWASSPEEVTVELIGEAIAGKRKRIILSSFNAG